MLTACDAYMQLLFRQLPLLPVRERERLLRLWILCVLKVKDGGEKLPELLAEKKKHISLSHTGWEKREGSFL